MFVNTLNVMYDKYKKMKGYIVMEFYDRMRIVRNNAELTQREISIMIGITQQQYHEYETGKHEMPIRYFIKFCIVTKGSADYILGLNATK